MRTLVSPVSVSSLSFDAFQGSLLFALQFHFGDVDDVKLLIFTLNGQEHVNS